MKYNLRLEKRLHKAIVLYPLYKYYPRLEKRLSRQCCILLTNIT